MTKKVNPKSLKKAERAVSLMKEGKSFDMSRRLAHISPAVLKRAMTELGVKWIRGAGKGRKVIIKRSLVDKAHSLIELLMDGKSASAASKMLHTALKTMKKQKLDGVDVLKKVKGRWKPNIIPIQTYSVVFYGKLLSNLGNTITGQLGTFMPRKKVKDDDLDATYSSIWWQYDINKFHTTLSKKKVHDFYPMKVLDFLRNELMGGTTGVSFPLLQRIIKTPSGYVNKFLQGIDQKVLNRIRKGIVPSGGIGLNLLEQFFNQMGVDLDDEIVCGIEKTGGKKFISLDDFKKNSVYSDKGFFVIFAARRGRIINYPDPPFEIIYKHDLKDEMGTGRGFNVDLMYN